MLEFSDLDRNFFKTPRSDEIRQDEMRLFID